MPDSPTKGIGKWISIIHRKTQIHMNVAAREMGLNLTESLFLTHITGDEPIHRKWLTEHLSVDDALTTRTLRGLEERGLVVQERSKNDQRALSVRLTDKGAGLLPKIYAAHRAWMEEITQELTVEETLRTGKILEQMAHRAIESIENRTEETIC